MPLNRPDSFALNLDFSASYIVRFILEVSITVLILTVNKIFIVTVNLLGFSLRGFNALIFF